MAMKSARLLLLAPLLMAAACSHTTSTDEPQQADYSQVYRSAAEAAVLASQRNMFKVSLYSKVHPLPLRSIHKWVVHIETMDGRPVEDARVFVFGGMPQHRHDFPTRPMVTAYLGEGNYSVEGIKFSMRGNWQMRFNIRNGNTEDRVIFDIPVY